MSSLTEAHDRLVKAVARLEQAAGDAPVGSDAGAELTALRERCQTLEVRNSEVTRRLDAAIERLRGVLAG